MTILLGSMRVIRRRRSCSKCRRKHGGKEMGRGRGAGGARGADDIAKFEDASQSAELGEAHSPDNSRKEKKRKGCRYWMWKVSFLYFPCRGEGLVCLWVIWVFCNCVFLDVFITEFLLLFLMGKDMDVTHTISTCYY